MTVVTWDAVNKGTGIELSNNDLTASIPNHVHTVRASKGKSEGKWYWEIKVDSMSNTAGSMIGIVNSNASLNAGNYNTQNVRYIASHNGSLYPGVVAYGERYFAGDVISVAVDLDVGTLTFYVNGVSLGVSYTNIREMREIFPAATSGSGSVSSVVTANFGATPFEYDVPEGHRPYRYNPTNKTLILNDGAFRSLIPGLPERLSENIVPEMTSNTLPSGIASSSSTYNSSRDPHFAFRESGSFMTSGNIREAWLRYDFGENSQKKIKKYSITGGSSGAAYVPDNWTFEGSNNGTDWVVLDSQSIDAEDYLSKNYYNIDNSEEFRMYQIKASRKTNGYITVARFELFEYASDMSATPPSWCTISNSLPTLSQFKSEGMEDLFSLSRKEQPYPQNMSSESLEEGKVFKSTVNLKKYFDLQKLEIK